MAYQVYGKGVNKLFVNYIHKHILEGIKPDLTFLLKVNINKALKRIGKRKSKNRYDKFTRGFYQKVQNYFIKVSKSKKRYVILDNSKDLKLTEQIIFKKVIKILKW